MIYPFHNVTRPDYQWVEQVRFEQVRLIVELWEHELLFVSLFLYIRCSLHETCPLQNLDANVI